MIILFASNKVGSQILEFLVEKKENIALLALHSSDPGGFNQQIEKTYREYSKSGMLITSDRFDEPELMKGLTISSDALGILAWWPSLLKKDLIQLLPRGWLNLHPSLLPYNRGKHPNFWCLVDETPCGVSLHFINEDIDCGRLIAQREIPCDWHDTGESVHAKSIKAIVELFQEQFDKIRNGTFTSVEIKKDQGSFHNASELDSASEIELDKKYSARDIFNRIRARMFPPYPTAFFRDGNKKYSVRIEIQEIENETEKVNQ